MVKKYCITGQATYYTIIWRMRIACWIPKTTDTHTHTHTKYVIFIAFPLQKWLYERASTLRYTYIGYLVNTFAASYLNNQGLNNSCLKSRQRRP